MIKILFVQPVLAPYSIPRYIELGKSKNLDIHLALETKAFSERPGWLPETIAGCTTHILKSFKYKKRLKNSKNNFVYEYTKTLPLGLFFKILKLKPDAVILCNPTQLLITYLSSFFLKFKIGIIIEETPSSESIKNKVVQILRENVYRRAHFAFYLSKDALSYTESIGFKGKIFKSFWSVNSNQIKKFKPQKNCTNKKQIHFLIVSALIERKGIIPFLEAWLTISKNHNNIRLSIIGEGPERKRIEAFCSNNNLDNITLIGQLTYDQVQIYYAKVDVFVFPTLEDLFGLVVTEAMAAGLPVLTTIYTGARELIIEGENGYTFDPLDKKSTCNALAQTINQKHNLKKWGAHSLKIMSEYTHEKIMKKMVLDIENLFINQKKL